MMDTFSFNVSSFRNGSQRLMEMYFHPNQFSYV